MSLLVLFFAHAAQLWAQPATSETFEVHRSSLIEKISRQSEPFEIPPGLSELLQLRAQFNHFMTYPASTFEHSVTKTDGTVVYKKIYHTHKFVRQTPQTNSIKNEHFIIAGDSNVFGLGANDDETLSAQVAMHLPQKKIYNLGIPGAGPNSMLSYMEKFSLAQNFQIDEKNGIMVYDFSFYLIERITGSVNCIQWCKNFPYYSVNQAGLLNLDGTIADHWAGKMYLFLKSFPFSQDLFPNLPKISTEHLKLTSLILDKIKTKYLNQTDKSNQLYVSINPFFNGNIDKDLVEEFIQLLKTKNIKVLTYSPVVSLRGINYEDGHLTPAALKTYADMLLKKLKAIEPGKF